MDSGSFDAVELYGFVFHCVMMELSELVKGLERAKGALRFESSATWQSNYSGTLLVQLNLTANLSAYKCAAQLLVHPSGLGRQPGAKQSLSHLKPVVANAIRSFPPTFSPRIGSPEPAPSFSSLSPTSSPSSSLPSSDSPTRENKLENMLRVFNRTSLKTKCRMCCQSCANRRARQGWRARTDDGRAGCRDARVQQKPRGIGLEIT